MPIFQYGKTEINYLKSRCPALATVIDRKFLRPETPNPTFLSVFLAASLVDVKMVFVRQLSDKFLIRYCLASLVLRTCLARKPVEIFSDKAANELLYRFVRHGPAAFEISGQGNEFRSEKTGVFDFLRQFGGSFGVTRFPPYLGQASSLSSTTLSTWLSSKGLRRCCLCPCCAPIFRFFFRGVSVKCLGGLTISEDGGLEEVAEFFFNTVKNSLINPVAKTAVNGIPFAKMFRQRTPTATVGGHVLRCSKEGQIVDLNVPTLLRKQRLDTLVMFLRKFHYGV